MLVVHQKDRNFLNTPCTLIDPDWDDYEIGSSFVIEEPFRKEIKKYSKTYDSSIFWEIKKKGKE
jgi:hypothetical protein